MVKFNRGKFKSHNKVVKNQQSFTNKTTNKIKKKTINAEKKVTLQKEVLLKEAVTRPNALVQNITPRQVQLDELSKRPNKKKSALKDYVKKPKLKHVQKHKKRQKTQISDTQLLLCLMNKKK